MGRGSRTAQQASQIASISGDALRSRLRASTPGTPRWLTTPEPSAATAERPMVDGLPAGQPALTMIAELIARSNGLHADISPGLRGTLEVQVYTTLGTQACFTVYPNGDERASTLANGDPHSAVRVTEDQVYVITAALGSAKQAELIRGEDEEEPLVRIGAQLWRVSRTAELVPAP